MSTIDRRSAAAAALLLWSALVLPWITLPGRTGLDADPARLLVVGGYLLCAPGLAFVLLLSVRDRLLSAVLALGFSWALLVLVAQGTLYLGAWSPGWTARGIVAGTAALTTAVLVRSLRARRRAPETNGVAS